MAARERSDMARNPIYNTIRGIYVFDLSWKFEKNRNKITTGSVYTTHIASRRTFFLGFGSESEQTKIASKILSGLEDFP